MILQEKTKLVTFGQKNPYKYLQSGQPEIIYESCIPNDSPYWISNGHNLFTEQGRPNVLCRNCWFVSFDFRKFMQNLQN